MDDFTEDHTADDYANPPDNVSDRPVRVPHELPHDDDWGPTDGDNVVVVVVADCAALAAVARTEPLARRQAQRRIRRKATPACRAAEAARGWHRGKQPPPVRGWR